MDFNHLYFQHQVASMRAHAASNAAQRLGHQQQADELGERIEGHQLKLGAAAACGWTALRAAASSNS